MALLSITAGDTDRDRAALVPALSALPAGAAVTVMIHGYRFCPDTPAHDPHRHILSLAPRRDCWKAVSWPRHLHLDRPGTGLGLGYGWRARGRLADVAARAFDTGDDLARLLRLIRDVRGDVHVNLMAHSLGSRVALAALSALPAGHVDRMILLSGAEYRDLARAAMTSPAGRKVEVLNVTSGENAPFDALFRLCVPAPRLADWPLSAGLPGVPGWTDLRVDCPRTLAALRRMGLPTRAPHTRVCHWSTYLRPGLFRLYRAVCDPRQANVLDRITRALPTDAPSRAMPARTGAVTGP
jgi:pimeloyl-ACP methyl ester carboxylesterase